MARWTASCVSRVALSLPVGGHCVWVCYLNERAGVGRRYFLGGKFGGIGELL